MDAGRAPNGPQLTLCVQLGTEAHRGQDFPRLQGRSAELGFELCFSAEPMPRPPSPPEGERLFPVCWRCAGCGEVAVIMMRGAGGRTLVDSQARNEHPLITVSSCSLLQGPVSAARAAGADAWESTGRVNVSAASGTTLALPCASHGSASPANDFIAWVSVYSGEIGGCSTAQTGAL